MSNDTYREQITMRNVLHIFMRISVPYTIIISIVGICGNFLTIIMLSKRSLSKNFNNCTLIALALTDLLFNLTLASRCVNDLTQSNPEKLCRLLSFLSHLAELLSACFTAQFTAQRFIAVRFPLSVFIEKKIHLVHYLIVTLFIICGVFYCLGLVHNNSYEFCHEELQLKWFISDAMLSFLLPFTLIIILNLLIIFQLKKSFQNNQQIRFSKRQQETVMLPLNMRKKTSSLCDMTYVRNTVPQSQTNTSLVLMNGRVRSFDFQHYTSSVRSKSQSYRVTRMLILVSSCFLLLNAPYHICTIGLKIFTLKQSISVDNSNPTHVYDHFQQYNQTLSKVSNNIDFVYMTTKSSDQDDMTNNFKWMEFFYLLVIITQHIAYASYSINFFLYSFCGIKFRRELIRCISKQHRQLTTSRSMTVQNTA